MFQKIKELNNNSSRCAECHEVTLNTDFCLDSSFFSENGYYLEFDLQLSSNLCLYLYKDTESLKLGRTQNARGAFSLLHSAVE